MERGVPELDLQGATDPARRPALVQAVAEAWRTWGVFLLLNHGVPDDVVEEARQQALRVFALPMDSKHTLLRAPGVFSGYGNGAGTNAHFVDRYVEHESMRLQVPGPDTRAFAQKLPPHPQLDNFCEAYEACSSACLKVARQVVDLVSEGLPEVDRPHILRYFAEPCGGGVRMNYYPGGTTQGLPAHTDIAALALLHQCDDGGGLQVEKDGQWVNVQARSDALVVIMGTVFQIFTNGERKACHHRAIQEAGKERLSIVFSLWPDPSLAMAAAPSFRHDPLRYRQLTFPQFWEAREISILDPLQCITIPAD
jgi:gibberellin 3-beta-dioxygenase